MPSEISPKPANGPDLGMLVYSLISLFEMPWLGSQSDGHLVVSTLKSPAPLYTSLFDGSWPYLPLPVAMSASWPLPAALDAVDEPEPVLAEVDEPVLAAVVAAADGAVVVALLLLPLLLSPPHAAATSPRIIAAAAGLVHALFFMCLPCAHPPGSACRLP